MPRSDEGRGTANFPEGGSVPHKYCSCGHVVDEHAQGGQCRAQDEDGRCNCQSVDVDEEER